jgi:hypothetical protein
VLEAELLDFTGSLFHLVLFATSPRRRASPIPRKPPTTNRYGVHLAGF